MDWALERLSAFRQPDRVLVHRGRGQGRSEEWMPADGRTGKDVLIDGIIRRRLNLVTKDSWGDVEVMLDFMIPRYSNSGVKLQGVYEIRNLR